MSLFDANTLIGQNYAYLVYKYNISIYDNVMHNIKHIYHVNALTDYVDICTIKTVFDLLDCRDSICTVNGFTMSNLYALLEELTTGD
jgi:hypothetical protein